MKYSIHHTKTWTAHQAKDCLVEEHKHSYHQQKCCWHRGYAQMLKQADRQETKTAVLQQRSRASWHTFTRAYTVRFKQPNSGRHQVVPNTNRRWKNVQRNHKHLRKMQKHGLQTREIGTSALQTEQGKRKQVDWPAVRTEHAVKERKQIQPPAIPQDTETSVDRHQHNRDTGQNGDS